MSLAAIGAAARIAGLGTFATFTSTTSASQSISSGTVASPWARPAPPTTA